VYLYVNGKLIPVETISEMGEEEISRMVEGVNSSMTYLLYCKTFVNATV
jgi:hypothetical protein